MIYVPYPKTLSSWKADLVVRGNTLHHKSSLFIAWILFLLTCRCWYCGANLLRGNHACLNSGYLFSLYFETLYLLPVSLVFPRFHHRSCFRASIFRSYYIVYLYFHLHGIFLCCLSGVDVLTYSHYSSIWRVVASDFLIIFIGRGEEIKQKW